jgi:DNA adenine methylase
MTDEDHRQMAATLHVAQGMVIVSGYACPLYDEELFAEWHRVERATHADGARDRVEVLWISPRTWTALHQNVDHLPLFAS